MQFMYSVLLLIRHVLLQLRIEVNIVLGLFIQLPCAQQPTPSDRQGNPIRLQWKEIGERTCSGRRRKGGGKCRQGNTCGVRRGKACCGGGRFRPALDNEIIRFSFWYKDYKIWGFLFPLHDEVLDKMKCDLVNVLELDRQAPFGWLGYHVRVIQPMTTFANG
jgi:hypothetical protein